MDLAIAGGFNAIIFFQLNLLKLGLKIILDRIRKVTEIIKKREGMKKDPQRIRIEKILSKSGMEVEGESIDTYREFLKKKLEFPCKVESMDFTPGRKLTLLRIVDHPDIDELEQGIIAEVSQGNGPGTQWPLADLECIKKSNSNHQFMDDYSVWFVNEGNP